MSLIACSSSSGHTAIRSLNYLRPLYAAVPLIFARATAPITTTTVRQFSTPVHTFNRLQSSATRKTPLSTAIFRLFTSSPIGTRGFNSKATLTAKESKKITWVIKNFSSVESKSITSDTFVVGGCKWHLLAYPKGATDDNKLSLYLGVCGYESLPSGWRRHAQYTLNVLNKNPHNTYKHPVIKHWFDREAGNWVWGRPSLLPFEQLEDKDSGFLVNGELKIFVEIDLFEAIGKLDVTDETSTSTIIETMDVNGIELLPSQAKSMSRVFEKHPDIAFGFRPMNPTLKTGYMSFLLSLIETACQSPQELSEDDICSAYAALKIMSEAGFKLDWLQKKLDDVSEIKEKGKATETQLRKMEDDLKSLKMKYSDMEALVEKEKANALNSKLRFSFDDVL